MSKINKTFSNGQPLDAKDLNDLAAGVNNAVPIDAESGVTKDGDNYYIKDADGNVLTVPHTSVGAMIADYIKNNPDQQAKVTFGASSLQALQTTIGTNLYGATTAAGLASVVAGRLPLPVIYDYVNNNNIGETMKTYNTAGIYVNVHGNNAGVGDDGILIVIPCYGGCVRLFMGSTKKNFFYHTNKMNSWVEI